ncbi:MAG: hypothetical protein A2359_02875 [Candidatus Moranbacteria bacterium RIFOXYB1_FULL_43_19]|nr:MAG: hypothetical protein A2184_02040 [Candidatus Moranbacteria bacterium RIFOXYA1_FULL_44_7]OGI27760.1 MAG: hypothetical protein A2359_02875 [Candidatus Moranbacteria bacterium RIFOXYB1_FULL_43_19]OGI33979.1 MAG: hypothetical protein A2420_03725 [Candidatus Moranbacteria bacterium RIFOXYC1_FULL_44_13]OGI37325.1 MAG: hypothetical protein A2612_05030 [Candidatus Moranbacteria bacterium RIFOXYD1_FULL_44_12]
MSKQEFLKNIKSLLPESEVFPEDIKEMLSKSLGSLTNGQLELLTKILKEEKEKVDALRKKFGVKS